METETQVKQWVDKTTTSLSGPGSYWMGWGAVFLGIYLIALCISDTSLGHINTDLFTYVSTFLAGLMFLLIGILSISVGRNLVNRAKIIDFLETGYRVQFWWRGRRKDIEFTTAEVESVSPCSKEKGFIELLEKLPREPICYQIKVRGQREFIVTGIDEAIHEAVKRISGK